MHIGPSEGLLICWLFFLVIVMFLEERKKEADTRYEVIDV